MSEERTDYGEIFYGLEHQETLDQGIEEVLERHFDHIPVDQMPETVRVLMWRHRPIRIVEQADAILENLLERLDEEHGSLDNLGTTQPTPRMTAAARAFLREVALEYHPWICDPTGGHETVEVRRWGIERNIQDPQNMDASTSGHPYVAAWKVLEVLR